LTVKSFDLLAIRKRYLKSKSRSKSGSVERREPAQGGIVYLVIENGILVDFEILAEIRESRGIDILGNLIALSSENRIYIFSHSDQQPLIIDHPWLSYIHTVRFNSDATKLLVSSSGLDSLLEFDLKQRSTCWEWIAWEHGYNEGENPETGQKHILTRHATEAQRLKERGKNVIYLASNGKQSLPTALRAAFMNSAEYSTNDKVLATLFHHGTVIEISKTTNSCKVICQDMSKPHGGMLIQNQFLVTDTGGGRVILWTDAFKKVLDFSALPGKSKELEALEWLQFSRLRDNTIVTIDSNRNAIIFIDIDNRKRMSLSYDQNWAIQEFTFVTKESKDTFNKIRDWFQ
jgi:hypothetical protein